jgi:hypothetical protein
MQRKAMNTAAIVTCSGSPAEWYEPSNVASASESRPGPGLTGVTGPLQAAFPVFSVK